MHVRDNAIKSLSGKKATFPESQIPKTTQISSLDVLRVFYLKHMSASTCIYH